MRAEPDRLFGDFFGHPAAFVRLRQKVCDGVDQQFPAEGQLDGAVAAGKETEETDSVKTGRQGVSEETPDKLVGVDCHDLLFVFVPVVFPLEGDLAVLVRDKPAIGDGDAMRVTPEIGKRLLRAAERRFRPGAQTKSGSYPDKADRASSPLVKTTHPAFRSGSR